MAKKKTDNPKDEPDTPEEQELPGTEPDPEPESGNGDDTPPEPGTVTF